MDDLKQALATTSPPSYLHPEEDDPRDLVIALTQAARLYDNNPWERLHHHGPMALQAPALLLSTEALGLADDEYPTLIIASTLDDYMLTVGLGDQIIAEEQGAVPLHPAPDPSEPIITLTFVPASHLPDNLLCEISTNDWPVASDDAYPILNRVGPDTPPSPLSFHTLRTLAGACAALSSLLESDPTLPYNHTARVPDSPTQAVGRVVCPHPHNLKPHPYRYEAELGPDLDLWLFEGMDAMIEDIQLYHTHRKPHPIHEDPRIHGALHYIAEQHIYGDPTAFHETYVDMLTTGMSRHEIIHRIGVPLLEKVADYMQTTSTFPAKTTPKRKPSKKRRPKRRKKNKKR